MTDFAGANMTLGLNPEPPRSWIVFLTSYGAQAVAVFLLVQLAMFKPVQVATHKAYQYISLTTPVEQSEPAPLKPQPRPTTIKVPVMPTPAPAVETARLRVPEAIRHVEQTAFQPVAIRVSSPAPALPNISTPKPAPMIVTGGFSAGSSAIPTVKAPVQQVQTGGFGDPNGVPAQNSPNKNGAAIAQVGSFDLPAGSGYGNGAGGNKGVRGTVASAGFGNGLATQTPVAGGRGNGVVVQAGFAESRLATDAPRQRPVETQAALTPVEIVSKPKPAYTEEARQLHLEGEVLVEVVFTAAGQVHALRVVRGLGHGLDENALRAAEQIRFKPAQRGGHAVDSTAVLHVVFQIA